MFKGYVINLDRHPKRLYHFNQHPDARYFERFGAIDKKQLDVLGNPALFFDINTIRQNMQRDVTLGEIACTLSHISVWQKVLLDDAISDNDFVVIAEDDVLLDKDFARHIHHLKLILNTTDIDILILQRLFMSDTPMNCQDRQFEILTNISFNHAGSALYMIKKSRIKLICNWLDAHKPFWLADRFTAFCPPNHIGLLYPMIGFVADDADSDLEADRNVARNKSTTPPPLP